MCEKEGMRSNSGAADLKCWRRDWSELLTKSSKRDAGMPLSVGSCHPYRVIKLQEWCMPSLAVQ